MGPVLVEACRYHRWANLHLMDVCAGLTETQLHFTAPGTYGTIAATFQHVVDAERWYLWRLGGSEGRFSRRHKFRGIAALRRLASLNGDQLIETAKHMRGRDAVVETYRGEAFRTDKGVILIQALHHGNDHRTHVCTILGHHGLTYGDMDVWAYGEATGAIAPISAKA